MKIAACRLEISGSLHNTACLHSIGREGKKGLDCCLPCMSIVQQYIQGPEYQYISLNFAVPQELWDLDRAFDGQRLVGLGSGN